MRYLPDCEDFDELEVVLTPEQEQKLIAALAEKGTAALDEFMEREWSDESAMARKMRKLREKLAKQAQRIKEREKEGMEKERERLKQDMMQELSLLKTTRSEAMAAYEDYERGASIELEGAIRDDAFLKLLTDLPDPDKKKSIGERFSLFFYKIRLAFHRLWKWILLKLGKTRKITARKDGKTIVFNTAAARELSYELDASVAKAIASETEFKKKLDEELDRSGGVNQWRRRADDEEYMDAAKRLMEEELRQREDAKFNEVEQKKEALQSQVTEAEEREKQRELEKEAERRAVADRFEKEMELLDRTVHERPKELLRKNLVKELKTSGYITEDDEGAITVTTSLVERFANIVLARELQKIPAGGQARFGSSENWEGIYEKDRMLMSDEASRMDIMETLINARLNHPGDRHISDEDIIINRELTGRKTHVVIMMDRSDSMHDNNRMLAAKKAVLALYKAVIKKDSNNMVDIVAFDTTVDIIDLMEAWTAEPKGFTNTGGALHIANRLFHESKADRRLAYLITDGLPEAYTNSKGKDVASSPETCLPYAIAEAKKLDKARLTILLLEPDDPMYVTAAEKIADATRHSRIIVTDPNALAKEVLEDFIEKGPR